MQSKRPLPECKTEAERQENWPQLCKIADMIETMNDPLKVLIAVTFIIKQRRRDREAGQE